MEQVYGVSKQTVIHSPLIRKILRVSATPGRRVLFAEAKFDNLGGFDEAQIEELHRLNGLENEVIESADTLDELLAMESHAGGTYGGGQPQTEDLQLPKQSQEQEVVTVIVRNSSLLIDGNVHGLPSSVRDCCVLPGQRHGVDDSVIISLSNGYLILVRLQASDEQWVPGIVQWMSLCSGAREGILDKLGRSVASHWSGEFFLSYGYQDWIGVFSVVHKNQGSYFQAPEMLKVKGSLVTCDFFGQAKHELCYGFYCVNVALQRLQLRSFFWVKGAIEKQMTRSVLPLSNAFGVPVMVIPLKYSNRLVYVLEDKITLISSNEIESGAWVFEEVELEHITSSFIVSFFQSDAETSLEEEVVVATSDGWLYKIVVKNGKLSMHELCKTEYFFSCFSLRTVEDTSYLLTFGNEKASGYKMLVRIENKTLEVVEVIEEYLNWGGIRGIELVDNKKVTYNSQELWSIGGKSGAGQIDQLRYGIMLFSQKVHKSLKGALKVFPVAYSTEESQYNYYFLISYLESSELVRYIESTDELEEIPFKAIVLDEQTIFAQQVDDYLVQVTSHRVVCSNISEILWNLEVLEEVILCDMQDKVLALVVENEKGMYSLMYGKAMGLEVAFEKFNLSIEPTCLRLAHSLDTLYLAISDLASDINVYQYEDEQFNWVNKIHIGEFENSIINDLLIIPISEDVQEPQTQEPSSDIIFACANPLVLQIHVSDQYGGYLQMNIINNQVSNFQSLNLGSLPIEFVADSDYIYLVSKYLWRINIHQIACPNPVLFASDRTVVSVAVLKFERGTKYGILRLDGYIVSRLSRSIDGYPKTKNVPFVPYKFKYIKHISCLCILTNKPPRLYFFSTKQFKMLKTEFKNKDLFSDSLKLLSVGEWDIRKLASDTVYRNLIIGCQNNEEGVVYVLELKKKNDTVYVNKLYNWKTKGPVLAISQYCPVNSLLYSSGNLVYTRKYYYDNKHIEPAKKQWVAGSVVTSIEVDGDVMVASTMSSSFEMFQIDENGDLELHLSDSVSRALTNNLLYKQYELLVVFDRLHSSLAGLNIQQDMAGQFKVKLDMIARLNKGSYYPGWFNDVEKYEDTRFIAVGTGGEVVSCSLLTQSQYCKLKPQFSKKHFLGTGQWELCGLREMYSEIGVVDFQEVTDDDELIRDLKVFSI